MNDRTFRKLALRAEGQQACIDYAGVRIASCGTQLWIPGFCGAQDARGKIGTVSDSCAQWQKKYVSVPLEEEHELVLADASTIRWDIRISARIPSAVEAVAAYFLVTSAYREYFLDEQQYKIPAVSSAGNAARGSCNDTSFVGLRFAANGTLPDVSLEIGRSSTPAVFSFENLETAAATYTIGVKSIAGRSLAIHPQKIFTFSLLLSFYEDRSVLDQRIEARRKNKHLFHADVSIPRDRIPYKRDPVFVFANVPWQEDGGRKPGVRAGSRWPHLKDDSEGDYLPFPFFLTYATALLKREGFAAHCLDALAENLSPGQFHLKLSRLNPDVVVMETSMPSFSNDMEIARTLSRAGIFVVLCGPFSYVYDERCMRQYPYIHAVFTGEYEFTALDFARALKDRKPLREVSGILYREKETIVKTAPRPLGRLDDLPWPERDSLPMHEYWDMPGNIPFPSVQMLSSRGCVFGCDFCVWPQVLFNKSYRYRSVADCCAEMRYLVQKKGARSVYWDDDTFNISPERTSAFAEEMVRQDLQAIPWAMMARADLMTPQILVLLRKAGLCAVKYGIENMNDKAQRACNKHLNLRKTLDVIRITRQLGIKIHLTFTFGYDDDTRRQIERTIEHALRLKPDSVQFSILTPFMGTELFETLQRQGRILDKPWSAYDGHHGCVFQPKHIDPDTLCAMKEYAYRRWFEYQRRRRGIIGDFKRFVEYCLRQDVSYAIKRSCGYVKHLFTYRADKV